MGPRNSARVEAQAGIPGVTKYYYANGQRVAMRQGSTLYWLLGDHLGSTALTAYYSGGKKAELRYCPYGKTRYTYGSTPTSLRFTGQREDATIGLYFYNARFYDPALGRFISADTIVPNPGNPQDLNRYAYARNSPLRYRDPSGHYLEVGDGGGVGPPPPPQVDKVAIAIDLFFLFFNGILGPLAGAYNTPVAGTSGGYGGNYFPPGQVGMAAAVDRDGYSDGLDYSQAPRLTPPGQAETDPSNMSLTGIIGEPTPFSYRAAKVLPSFNETPRDRLLYRGLRPGHPQIQIYNETGLVQPRGGNRSLWEHVNYGRTESPHTSWTLSYAEANRRAGPNGIVLTVNEMDIPNYTFDSYLWSRYPREREVSIWGPVYGATVVPR